MKTSLVGIYDTFQDNLNHFEKNRVWVGAVFYLYRFKSLHYVFIIKSVYLYFEIRVTWSDVWEMLGLIETTWVFIRITDPMTHSVIFMYN